MRKRTGDIVLLARHFIKRYILKYNINDIELTNKDEEMLKSYHWPGNIRELQNVIERAVLLSTGGKLAFQFPGDQMKSKADFFEDLPSLDEIQRRYIKYILEKTNGKLSGPGGATEILNMKRTILYNRMKKLGLR